MTEVLSLDHTEIWDHLRDVPDPEIPVVNVVEMGIVRAIRKEDHRYLVDITPTYSGCPAMKEIEDDISAKLEAVGVDAKVNTVLSPAWTTDWITAEAREKLRVYGIAPPQGSADKAALLGIERNIPCPRCRSTHTEMLSQFGSTACKALHRCKDCLEPFDYFKCI